LLNVLLQIANKLGLYAKKFCDEVVGFFNFLNRFCRTMALGLNEPLTELGSSKLVEG
jgi:hypothetical protein